MKQQESLQQIISKAKTLQGYLEKKGDLQWQKRFFSVVEPYEKEFYLAYQEKQTDQRAKGTILIADIKEIVADGDKEFLLKHPNKNFKLRAQNTQIRDEWVAALIHLKKYVTGNGILDERKKSLQNSPLKQGTISQSPRSHRNSELIKPNKSHKVLDPELSSKISLSLEDKRLGSDSNICDSPTKVHKTAEDIFDILGLQQYIDGIKPKEVIQNRMIYGYLRKQSKTNNKSGYMRFFLLISSKPLYLNKGYTDERILTNSDLPPWMDIDKIYYFDSSKITENKKSSKELLMNDILEVKQFDSIQSHQEKGFVFIVSEQKRDYYLCTNLETDRQKWISALNVGIATAKEIKKGGGQIKKNVDTIAKIYDQSDTLQKKKADLRKKIDTDCMHFVLNYYGEEQKNDNIFTLISYLTDVVEDMKNTLEACLHKEPPRQDIIKEYSEYLHEKILQEIKQFWDQHHEKINNEGILSLAKFFHDYNEKLKKYVKDIRLEDASNTLLNIYASRSMTISEETIGNMIQSEKKITDPLPTDEDYIYSTTPVDLFKLINTAIDSGYRVCPTNGFLKAVGKFAQFSISFYQEALQEALEDDLFNEKQLIVFCNNTVKFEEKVKEFQKRVQTIGQFSDEEVDEMLKTHEIIKQFITISTNAYNNIASNHLCKLRALFQKKNFLDLNLDYLFNTIFENAKETTQLLFMKYQKKLWKDILDYLILFYFQTMIQSCKKAKKEHLQQYIQKLKQDQQFLQDQFNEILFKKQLEQSLCPFQHISNLLTTEDGSDVQKDIKKLRIAFGIAFTHKTVAYIFQIRKDLNKDDIEYVINTSENTIQQYNKEHENDEILQRIDIGKPIEVLGIDIDQDQQEGQNDADSSNQRLKKKTIFISINTDDSLNTSVTDITQKDNKGIITYTPYQEENLVEKIEEGYLYKRKPDKYVYDKRYFKLRDNGLYWFLTETSQDVQNKIDITQIDEVNADGESQNLFEIVLQGTKGKKGKIYKFKAENKQERDLWIQSIKLQMKAFDEKHQKEIAPIEAINIEGNIQKIITDYEEIKRKQRALQQALERKKKQEEKEERARQLALMMQQNQKQDQQIAPSVSIHELRSSSQRNASLYAPTPNQFVIYKNDQQEPLIRKQNQNCFDKISQMCSDFCRKFK
ncbi:hypothetical protein ABPG72_006490 [Tetrahymena utriculariae]